MKVTLRRGAFAEERNGASLLARKLVCVPGTRCMGHLCCEGSGDGLDVKVSLCVRNRHLSSFAFVSFCAEQLAQRVLKSESSPHEHTQLSVLTPQDVINGDGRGQTCLCSLFSHVLDVEGDTALPLDIVHHIVPHRESDHELVRVQSLLRGEGILPVRVDLAVVVHHPKNGDDLTFVREGHFIGEDGVPQTSVIDTLLSVSGEAPSWRGREKVCLAASEKPREREAPCKVHPTEHRSHFDPYFFPLFFLTLVSFDRGKGADHTSSLVYFDRSQGVSV
mmetsp:Transcript_31412/g.62043  ORF Transcript_31412/g.62043 Transcript_31412/m.62043 type:complete len:277 (+) Transcript_31412:1878-2708(+)